MSAQPGRGYLGISEVLAKLRPDFPDVSVSKIRFLETEGLIAPARAPSGYRRFGAGDVERLRYILTAQRDQYLPLRVIKERLARADQAGPSSAGPGLLQPAAPAPRRPADLRADGQRSPDGHRSPDGPDGGADAQLTRRELLDRAGITDPQLTELELFGLLRKSGRLYGGDALEVARTAAALTAYGVEARHLRTVRAAVEREVNLIEHVVAPILKQRGAGARELAGQTAGELAALAMRLHRALIEGALAEAGLAGPGRPTEETALADRERAARRRSGVGGASA
jgi:DNA-binding transcriptional MerR regulator